MQKPSKDVAIKCKKTSDQLTTNRKKSKSICNLAF